MPSTIDLGILKASNIKSLQNYNTIWNNNNPFLHQLNKITKSFHRGNFLLNFKQVILSLKNQPAVLVQTWAWSTCSRSATNLRLIFQPESKATPGRMSDFGRQVKSFPPLICSWSKCWWMLNACKFGECEISSTFYLNQFSLNL